jgi:superfamily II DNA or RNA helicase
MSCLYENIEIDENASRAIQPEKILIKLKEHQLACLHKACIMERNGSIQYNITESLLDYYNDYMPYTRAAHNTNIKDNVTVNTNIGILGDIVGYGKTLTALAIIASVNVNDIHINNTMNISYCSNRNYGYLSYTTANNNVLKNDNIIKSTLIIVPRGPVYIQWQKCLEQNTTLKFLAIDNVTFIKKHLPEFKNDNFLEIIDFFNKYDVVLIKNTTLDQLFSYYHTNKDIDHMSRIPFIKRWKRIMIDEAHDIMSKISLMYFEYLWLISGTYENILYANRSYSNIIYHMKDAINCDTINLILVKGKKEFVRNSFRIPLPVEKYYACKMNAKLNAIRKFISPEILEKISANDIVGAVRDLGGKSETVDNIIELVCKEIKREILNKEKERSYIESLDIPAENKANRLKNIDNDIEANKEKLNDLTRRICEVNEKLCAICMMDMENPIMLKCTHSYCGQCIVKWIDKNMNCPECRQKIDMNNMYAVVKCNDKSPAKIKQLSSKEDTLLEIIQKNPNGKYLVFSKYDSSFFNIMQILNANNITSSELKGNTSHMMNVLQRFKSGELKVILLNTNFAGSGIDISYATDVVIFHSMGAAKNQAIGRAQRVGRHDILSIHYLCYEHEMEK